LLNGPRTLENKTKYFDAKPGKGRRRVGGAFELLMRPAAFSCAYLLIFRRRGEFFTSTSGLTWPEKTFPPVGWISKNDLPLHFFALIHHLVKMLNFSVHWQQNGKEY